MLSEIGVFIYMFLWFCRNLYNLLFSKTYKKRFSCKNLVLQDNLGSELFDIKCSYSRLYKFLTLESASQNKELFEKISSFLKKEGVTKVAIFGSYAREEERPESDIDILVDFSETKGLLTMVRIERELSEFLGVKVDLLIGGSISPYLIERIKKEAKLISA